MKNNKVVSIRLSNSAKWSATFQVAHDFLNSHGRKRSNSNNYTITLNDNSELVKELFERDLKNTHEVTTMFNRYNKLITLISSTKKEIKINYANESTRELLQETLRTYQEEIEDVKITIKSHLKGDNNLGLKHYDKFLDFEERAKADWKATKNRAMQSNTNLFINGIITFGNQESNLSRLKLEEINSDELDIAAYNAVQRLAKENGVKVLYLVKHIDESQVHYHYALENYNFTTHKTVAVQMRAKSYLKSTQDLVAEEFEHLGFQRGKSSDIRLSEYLESNEMSKEDFYNLPYATKQEIYKQINSKRIADYKKSTVDAKDALYIQKKALKELEQKKVKLLKYKDDLQATINTKAKNIVYKGKPSREAILSRVVAQLEEISNLDISIKELNTIESIQTSTAQENNALTTKNKRLSNSIKLQSTTHEALQVKYQALLTKNLSLSKQVAELEKDIQALSKEYKFNYTDWKKNRESKYLKFLKERKEIS